MIICLAGAADGILLLLMENILNYLRYRQLCVEFCVIGDKSAVGRIITWPALSLAPRGSRCARLLAYMSPAGPISRPQDTEGVAQLITGEPKGLCGGI